MSCPVCEDHGLPGGCLGCGEDSECGASWPEWTAPTVPVAAVEAERRHLIGLEDVARVWPASPVDGWLPERRERAFAALLWAIRETRERIEAWETDRSVEATTPRGEAA